MKAVVAELSELISQIEADCKAVEGIGKDSLAINYFNTKEQSTSMNGQFIFSQVLIDCLLQLKSTEADTNELIQHCKEKYKGNVVELQNIDKFQKEYSPKKALWWYTIESFFYKTLNAALRTQDIHLMFLFRSYISDIHRQLKSCQVQHPLRVFRSQILSKYELKILQKCVGQLISVNSFFSTSTEYHQTLSFLDTTKQANNLEPITFEIHAHPKMVTTKPFGNIMQHSAFSDEGEVLFMIGSMFRVNSVDRNKDKVWVIKMTLCNENEHDLRDVLEDMTQQFSRRIDFHTFGKIVWKLGKFDLAERYITRLLNELPENDPLKSSLYRDLAELASVTGNLDKSVNLHQKALKLKKSTKSSNKVDGEANSFSKFIDTNSLHLT